MKDDDDFDCCYHDDPCDHDDRDIDILSGRWICYRCGEAGWASDQEIEAELRHHAEYAELVEREERRARWRELFAPVINPIRSLRRRFNEWRTRRQFPEHANDDIPF